MNCSLSRGAITILRRDSQTPEGNPAQSRHGLLHSHPFIGQEAMEVIDSRDRLTSETYDDIALTKISAGRCSGRRDHGYHHPR